MISKITPDDLAKHAKWLRDEECGVRIVTGMFADLRNANLCNANLRGANLSDANLSRADLRDADLSDANLRDADLNGANLRGANLSDANLRGANLSRANLRDADLNGADLRDADLSRADLSRADLRDANLRDANLRDADLNGANLSRADLRDADLSDANLRDANLRGANLSDAKNIPDYAIAVTSILPEGDLIVYKKLQENKIAKLLVPKEAKRSNATGRKCRAEYAQVLAIESVDGKKTFEKGISNTDCNFVYKVGETVRPDSWDEDRWNECSHGVHFFLTRYEAENY